jgi:hypothetical protein
MMQPYAATVPALKPGLLRISPLISSPFTLLAFVMQTASLSRHGTAAGQLDQTSAFRAKEKVFNGRDMGSLKPSQVATVD